MTLREVIRAEIKAAVREALGVPAPERGHEALSKREAARLLGIDRSTTLLELIRQGRLRVVTIGGRERIPRAEIDRLLQPGPAPAPRRARATVRAVPPASDADALRKIRLRDL